MTIDKRVRTITANENSNVFTGLWNFPADFEKTGNQSASSMLWRANEIGNNQKNQDNEVSILYENPYYKIWNCTSKYIKKIK